MDKNPSKIGYSEKDCQKLVNAAFWYEYEFHFMFLGGWHPTQLDSVYDKISRTWMNNPEQKLSEDTIRDITCHLQSCNIEPPSGSIYTSKRRMVLPVAFSPESDEKVYDAVKALTQLKDARWPIHPDLIKALIEKDHKILFKLLLQLPKQVRVWMETGEFPPDLKNEAPQENSKDVSAWLPQPLKNWKNVSFCILKDIQFEIQVAGKNYSQEEVFGKSPPEYLINFLYQIVHKGGTFENGSFNGIKNTAVREYKGRLNKLLEERFGINKAPIVYSQKAKQYKSEFKCESEINTETDSADYSPEGNTPSGVSTDKIRESFKRNE